MPDDMDAKGVTSAQISPHYYSTAGEVDTAVETLREMVE
jgi:hypothetical protein